MDFFCFGGVRGVCALIVGIRYLPLFSSPLPFISPPTIKRRGEGGRRGGREGGGYLYRAVTPEDEGATITFGVVGGIKGHFSALDRKAFKRAKF